VNVPTPSKSYVTAKFTGKLSSEGDKRYTIHNLARPLFAQAENAHIHDINLGNVDINMPWANKTAPLGEMFKKSTIENIKVTGNVVGNNDVTGMVNKLDESNMRNVAFIGNITSVGNAGWWSGGLVSESWRSNTDNSYIDAYIKGNKAKVGGLVAKLNHGDNPRDVGAWGRLKNSVAKGTIDVKEPLETGGLLHSNWSWGLAENNVTMMKVKNGGEILYGSRDAEDDDYFGANWVRNNNVFVNGVSEGKQSYSRSSRWKGVSKPMRKQLWWLGFFNYTATFLLQFIGLKYTSAASATTMIGLEPLCVIFIGHFFFQDRAKWYHWLCGAFAFLGVAILILGGQGNEGSSEISLLGCSLVVAASIVFACCLRWTKKVVATVSAQAYTSISIVLASITMLPFTLLLTENWDIHFNWLGFFGLIYLGVACSWFAFWLWNKGLNSVDAKISGILTALEPIFGVFLAVLLLNEEVSLVSALGIIIIVASAIGVSLLPKWLHKEIN